MLGRLLKLFRLGTASKKMMEKKPDQETEQGTYIITVPVVMKEFVNKGGRVTNQKEWYIQRSIQDYFIKFCESKVTAKELEDQLAKVEGFIKMLQLEVEFRKGHWDICDGNMMQQSRVGEYVVIHKIIKDS